MGASYITRGKSSISSLISTARYNGANRIYILTDYAGNPKQLLEITLNTKNWEFTNIYNIKLYKLCKETNVRPRDVGFAVASKPYLQLAYAIGVEPNIDYSEFTLVEKNNICSLYKSGKEIGPVFSLDLAK